MQKFVARLRDWLEKQINTIKASTTNEREASESFAAHAIGIIADSNRLLTAVESIFGEHAFLRQEPLSSSDRTARLQIPDLPPGALLHLTDSICVLGDAGAGKTSVARKLTREALNRGIKVVYFPCLRIQDTLGSPLRDEIANFVAGISGVSSTIASKAVGSARLIVLDGCDEAATLQDDIAR